MKKDKTPEDLLHDQIALCTASLATRLANADGATDYAAHDRELQAAIALLGASARLAGTLARLRGVTTHNIRVTREGAPSNSGSNGQAHRKS